MFYYYGLLEELPTSSGASDAELTVVLSSDVDLDAAPNGLNLAIPLGAAVDPFINEQIVVVDSIELDPDDPGEAFFSPDGIIITSPIVFDNEQIVVLDGIEVEFDDFQGEPILIPEGTVTAATTTTVVDGIVMLDAEDSNPEPDGGLDFTSDASFLTNPPAQIPITTTRPFFTPVGSFMGS